MTDHYSLDRFVLDRLARRDAHLRAADADRERTIISLIGMGKGTGEIAGHLFISPATVRTHVRNAMSKLGAHTRAELVARVFAYDDDLMDPIGESIADK